jgi:hypothetical protein
MTTNRTTDKQINAAVDWFVDAFQRVTDATVDKADLHHGNASYGYSYWLMLTLADGNHKQFDLGYKKGEARARLMSMTQALDFVRETQDFPVPTAAELAQV